MLQLVSLSQNIFLFYLNLPLPWKTGNTYLSYTTDYWFFLQIVFSVTIWSTGAVPHIRSGT